MIVRLKFFSNLWGPKVYEIKAKSEQEALKHETAAATNKMGPPETNGWSLVIDKSKGDLR